MFVVMAFMVNISYRAEISHFSHQLLETKNRDEKGWKVELHSLGELKHTFLL